MDNILNKFSPQNFLRQFFCGFIFFVPLWLFAPAILKRLLGGSPWQFPQCFGLAILACIIGTIIYHVEKNLYSYGLQALFEMLEGKITKKWWETTLAVILAIAIIVGSICCLFFCKSAWWLLLLLIAPLDLIFYMREKILQRTQKAWAIEAGCKHVPGKDMQQDYNMSDEARKAIADKIATWSDFIHCTQTCCFAWLLGVIMISIFKGSFPDDMSLGNIFSLEGGRKLLSCQLIVILLVFEVLFDWHRYRHVIAMTDGEYTKVPDKNN